MPLARSWLIRRYSFTSIYAAAPLYLHRQGRRMPQYAGKYYARSYYCCHLSRMIAGRLYFAEKAPAQSLFLSALNARLTYHRCLLAQLIKRPTSTPASRIRLTPEDATI